DHDAADDFALPVEIDGAAALIVSDLDVTDVADVDRSPLLVSADDQVLELVDVVVVDRAAQLIVAVRYLDHSPAGFLKHVLHRGDDVAQRDSGSDEKRREDLELKLLFQSSDRSDLSHPR